MSSIALVFNARADLIAEKFPYSDRNLRSARREALNALDAEFAAALREEYLSEAATDAVAKDVYAKAYEDGHAHGYSEIESHYIDLAALVIKVLASVYFPASK